MMANTLHHRDIISIHDLSKEEILYILEKSRDLKRHPPKEVLKGLILGSCFFEPSTRTRLSFESAMKRLGGNVIGFSEASSTSTAKGESLYDSMKIMGQYADFLVIRHPLEGSARLAADATDKPVINAGDGSNQHPTQTLLDLATIQECQGGLEGMSIAFVGDLKYGRTVHSLAQASAHFNMRLYFVTSEGLEMPEEICDDLRKKGVRFSLHKSIEEVVDKVDILYMTRIQEERFPNKALYERLKNNFVLQLKTLKSAKPHLKVFHPLPRVGEIAREIDSTPHAYYFEQAQNGVYVRQALLMLVLGKMD
jgi:aspartate carbamoyltransferase catalytic subunit